MRRAPVIALLLLALLSGGVLAQDEVAPDAPAAGGEAPVEAPAPPAEPPPPIYEDQLLRLSEILGALSFLRKLCGESDGDAWRGEMQALMATEHPGLQRRARLAGRFNHGFETFNALYRSCTPSARLAISRYLAEGAKLSGEVRSRYSQ